MNRVLSGFGLVLLLACLVSAAAPAVTSIYAAPTPLNESSTSTCWAVCESGTVEDDLQINFTWYQEGALNDSFDALVTTASNATPANNPNNFAGGLVIGETWICSAACSDDNGSTWGDRVNSTGYVVEADPTPTPTPTPTPEPTASPTPTPGPTASPAGFDYTHDDLGSIIIDLVVNIFVAVERIIYALVVVVLISGAIGLAAFGISKLVKR